MHSITPKTQAILLMIGAFFFFSSMDATVKELTQHIGTIPSVWARYAGQTLMVLLIVSPRLKSVMRTRYPGLQLARSVLLMIGTVCFFFGLSHIGLTEATALMDVNPVLITLGAALFLGEHLGPRRLFGISAALIGAMIIIRPGSGVFSLYALYPLGAAAAYSGYALVTRFVGRNESPWTSLLYTGIFGAVVLSCIVPFYWVTPSWEALKLMGVLAICGTASQLLLIRALTLGEAAMLAPFSYSGLIFAPIYGIILFDEFPDLWTIIGALVIAVSGIYVWHRETRG